MALSWKLLILLASLTKAEIVRTPSGPVEGTTGTSRDGRTYYVFHGIPYAEPPVESLRLKNPVAIKPWTDVKNTTAPANPCLQLYGFGGQDINLGSEDCLYLNIFTPKLTTDKPLPVLFHVHGGAFQGGVAFTGHSVDYLMDEDIVVVSVQYRVGIMGFLSLEDEIIPGNFGLKDQSTALAWVKSNIASFGGDPEKITATGESAGGASVHYLMKSPLSKGSLKGGISQCGVVGKSAWVLAEKNSAKPRALKVAEMVDCKGSSQEILTCLQKKDSAEILPTIKMFNVWDLSPLVVFKPVIEKNMPGAFITEDPKNVKSDIPWITGANRDEGILFMASLMVKNESLVDDFIKNIDNYLAQVLCIDPIDDKAKESVKLIKEKYFSKLDRESVLIGIKDVASDGLFKVPMISAVETHSGPKYVYINHYRGSITTGDAFGKQPKDLGVSHGDDMLLIFNMKNAFPISRESAIESDVKVSKNLVKMWANFANEGKPSNDWKEWKNGEHLLIKETNEMKENFDKETVNFWLNLPMYKKEVTTSHHSNAHLDL